MRLLTAGALFAIGTATSLVLLLPLAIFGGVTHVEPNVFIRWTEFGASAAGAILGLVEVLRWRRDKRRER